MKTIIIIIYLETVWPELLASADAHGLDAGLSATALGELHELLTPGSGAYILDEPGYYVMHPT